MDSLQLLFSTTNLPLSWVIRAGTLSQWSHVAIVDGRDVIEAVAFAGVRRQPLVAAIDAAADHRLVTFELPDAEAALAAARSQLGAPYDWGGVAGIAARRNWQSCEAWFCSELAAWALMQGGRQLFRREAMRRVAPEHLWMCAPSLNRQPAAC